MTLLISAVLWHQRMQNISSVTSRSDFIMQNYYVKKLEVIFTVRIKIKRKLKVVYNFCVYIFSNLTL
jgi:hypothetical protein